MDRITISLTEEVTSLHANICSALADPRRILIIYALAKEPRTVNDLAEAIGASQPATSRHLKTLRECDLVRTTRLGSSVEYSLADPRLVEALDLLRLILRDRIAHHASLIED